MNLKYEGYSLTYIEDIWGDSPNNIYAVGSIGNSNCSPKAMILKYNGVKWSPLNIPDIEAGFIKIVKDSKGSGNYYLFGENVIWDTTTNPVTLVRFVEKNYEYDGLTNIHEIFSSTNEMRLVNDVGGKAYFTSTIENKIFKYNGNQYEVFKDFTSTKYIIGTIWGMNDNDIFMWSSLKNNHASDILTHYNGTDIAPLFEADHFYNCLILAKDIFVIIDGKVRGIAHGRLSTL